MIADDAALYVVLACDQYYPSIDNIVGIFSDPKEAKRVCIKWMYMDHACVVRIPLNVEMSLVFSASTEVYNPHENTDLIGDE